MKKKNKTKLYLLMCPELLRRHRFVFYEFKENKEEDKRKKEKK